jgi:hypothetical protein
MYNVYIATQIYDPKHITPEKKIMTFITFFAKRKAQKKKMK